MNSNHNINTNFAFDIPPQPLVLFLKNDFQRTEAVRIIREYNIENYHFIPGLNILFLLVDSIFSKEITNQLFPQNIEIAKEINLNPVMLAKFKPVSLGESKKLKFVDKTDILPLEHSRI